MDKIINKDSAVILFSGGQDSTTCLFWAKQKFKKIYALAFSYGQKHIHEIDIAKNIAQIADVEFHLIDADFISTLGNSSLTNTKIKMDESKPINSYPNTFVPGRNLFFISIAAVFARERNINYIITGVSQTDFSGYPDCRDSFIKSMNVALNEAMDYQFIIETPLMWLNKAETWELSDRLGVFDLVKNETLTCYNGIKGDGCGHCPSCKLRNEGLNKYLLKRKNNQNE